uniref:Histone H2A n=1 Tax=Timema bartmani TaxID=61472 RepID=A0A7R9EVX3_9NEOP|nr:unnamed protein product [Timema bartmani]
MWGQGKDGKVEWTSMLFSSHASLQFPVCRTRGLFINGNYTEQVGIGDPVALAAVMEYLAAEVYKLARNAARDNRSAVSPHEFNKLLSGKTIAQDGILPNIQAMLLRKKD